MEDFDFDSFLSDIKGSLDNDSFDWDAPAGEPEREDLPREELVPDPTPEPVAVRPERVRKPVPVMPTVEEDPRSGATKVRRPRGSVVGWVIFAILALMGIVTPGAAKLFFWLAALLVMPIRPIRSALSRFRVPRVAVWLVAVVLFFVGCVVAPSSSDDETAENTPPARSVMAAVVPETTATPLPTDTPIPTDTPEPTPSPEPTPEPTPTPEAETTSESVRGYPADKTVYISNSSGTVHSRDNCSGMKNYWTTTIKAADEGGYKFCEKCW